MKNKTHKVIIDIANIIKSFIIMGVCYIIGHSIADTFFCGIITGMIATASTNMIKIVKYDR